MLLLGNSTLPAGRDRSRYRDLSCLRAGVSITRALAHMLDSLVRVSRRVGSQCPTRRQNLVPEAGTWSAGGTLRERARQHEYPLGQNRAMMPSDSLASNDFTYCLTLFPKCFSSFPHGTCSLSVSRQYLALEGFYLPLHAAFPSNATRRNGQTVVPTLRNTGFSPSLTLISIKLSVSQHR